MNAAAELFNAVSTNDFISLQMVLMEHPELDINQYLLGTMTALHLAAQSGYSAIVTVLLVMGAKVDTQDEYGTTALMNAVCADSPLVVQKLLAAGADCCLVKDDGDTALHMAVELNNVSIIQMLINHGSSIHSKNESNVTPLTSSLLKCRNDASLVMLFNDFYVDANVLARDCRTNLFLYFLKHNKFMIAKSLLLLGYKAVGEFRQWEALYDKESELNMFEINALHYIKLHMPNPCCLQHACRIVIRKALQCNIEKKLKQLNIPSTLKDYIYFTDVYKPPEINLTHNVTSFTATY